MRACAHACLWVEERGVPLRVSAFSRAYFQKPFCPVKGLFLFKELFLFSFVLFSLFQLPPLAFCVSADLGDKGLPLILLEQELSWLLFITWAFFVLRFLFSSPVFSCFGVLLADPPLLKTNRLAGLVFRRPCRARKLWGSSPACDGIFPGPSPTSDLKIGTPVATLPALGVIASALGLVGPLGLDEVESLIYNFYFSVAARKIVCADPSLRYTSMLLGR